MISLPKGTLVDVRWTERGPHRQGVRGLERIRQWLPPGGRVGDAAILSKQTEGETLRPAILIVLAVLIAALWAFDGYEYDGHYRAAAWDYTKQEAAKLEHQIEDMVGSHK